VERELTPQVWRGGRRGGAFNVQRIQQKKGRWSTNNAPSVAGLKEKNSMGIVNDIPVEKKTCVGQGKTGTASRVSLGDYVQENVHHIRGLFSAQSDRKGPGITRGVSRGGKSALGGNSPRSRTTKGKNGHKTGAHWNSKRGQAERKEEDENSKQRRNHSQNFATNANTMQVAVKGPKENQKSCGGEKERAEK